MDEYDISPLTSGTTGSILSSLYRRILLTLGVSAPLFSRLIYKHCLRSLDPALVNKNTLRNKEVNIMTRLMDTEFTFDTFITGLDVLGVEKFQLILTLHDGDIKDVKRYESSLTNVREVEIIDGSVFLFNFFEGLLKKEHLDDFDESYYPLLKSHYKFLSNSKSGKSFISNLARAYRNKFVSWMVLYRLIAALGFNNGTISVVLKHFNGRKTLHNNSFFIN